MKENYMMDAWSLECDSILSIIILKCIFAQMSLGGWHVLVCMRHREQVDNQNLLKKFKSDRIEKHGFENFTKNINTSYYSGLYGNHVKLMKEDVRDDTIFLFQTIRVGDVPLNLFFDSGCGDMVIRKGAIETLELQGRAALLYLRV